MYLQMTPNSALLIRGFVQLPEYNQEYIFLYSIVNESLKVMFALLWINWSI